MVSPLSRREKENRTIWNEREHASEERELVYEISWISELGVWRLPLLAAEGENVRNSCHGEPADSRMKYGRCLKRLRIFRSGTPDAGRER
jgi:hypothetical protein